MGEDPVLPEGAMISCLHYKREITSEECMSYFSESDRIIRTTSCIAKSCRSPAKPCDSCFDRKVKKPEDEKANYYHTRDGKSLCPFHLKNGKDADPALAILERFIPVKKITKKSARLADIKIEEEKGKKGMEDKIVTLKVAEVLLKPSNKVRSFRKLDKLIAKLKAKNYDPIRVRLNSTEGVYYASTDPYYYNARMLAAAKEAGIEEISAVIKGKPSKTKRETDETVAAETKKKTRKMAKKATDRKKTRKKTASAKTKPSKDFSEKKSQITESMLSPSAVEIASVAQETREKIKASILNMVNEGISAYSKILDDLGKIRDGVKEAL